MSAAPLTPMTAAPVTATPAPKPANRARRIWLARAVRAGGWRNPAAAGMLVLDGVCAIGFAGALAGGVSAFPHGLGAMAPWLMLGSMAAAGRGMCALAGARFGARASARVRTTIRRGAVVACLGRPLGRDNQMQTGEMMTVAVDAVETLDGYVARFLPAQRAAAVVPLLVLAATALASPISATILASTLVPFIALMILAGGAAADESRRQFAALARLSGLFADRIRTLPVVLAFQAEDRETARLGGAADELRRRTMGVLRVAFVSSAGLEFFAALSVALVAVYAGFNLLHLLPFHVPEQLDLPRALFVLALAPEFYAPARRVAAAYHDRQAAETAADRLMALETAPAPPRPRQFTAAPRIRFDGASAWPSHPGDNTPPRGELTFEVGPGQIAVLLGPSGSGKTTALRLLLGLAPLASGEVWIDDDALSGLGSVAGSVAWAGDAPVIIPGSIADNIALAFPSASRADIAHAAAQVGLGPTLCGRSAALDSLVDERGSGLSGGERRRIALARAVLKPAPILLLDEPTAHLDAPAEAAMIAAIRRAAAGRTTIIATHSPALAAIGDVIVRLDA
jgi:ATP-binding cassette subfamily C protein CydD